MRRYDDPVEVRRGEHEGPDQFLWRGRLWQVRDIVAHWEAEREFWRVTAGRGRAAAMVRAAGPDGDPGLEIFDLTFDWASGDWRLAGAVD